jgi:hypothetical protein
MDYHSLHDGLITINQEGIFNDLAQLKENSDYLLHYTDNELQDFQNLFDKYKNKSNEEKRETYDKVVTYLETNKLRANEIIQEFQTQQKVINTNIEKSIANLVAFKKLTETFVGELNKAKMSTLGDIASKVVRKNVELNALTDTEKTVLDQYPSKKGGKSKKTRRHKNKTRKIKRNYK